MSEELLETHPTPEQPAKRTRRVTRRTALKTGAAAAAGVAMAAYVKPGMTSVGVPEVQAITGGYFPPCEPGQCQGMNVSIDVTKVITSISGGVMYGTITIDNVSGDPYTARVIYWEDKITQKIGQWQSGPYVTYNSNANAGYIPNMLGPSSDVEQADPPKVFNFAIPLGGIDAAATEVKNTIIINVLYGHEPLKDFGSSDTISVPGIVQVSQPAAVAP